MAKSKWPQVKERFAEIEIWLHKGLSEKQVCKNLGVSVSTWETYKARYPELPELLKSGKKTPVSEVENALFKTATGYYYTTQEYVKLKDSDGNETVQIVTLTKFKPPETGAMCFFLKNKDKKNYADNPNMIDLKREELEIRRREAGFRTW